MVNMICNMKFTSHWLWVLRIIMLMKTDINLWSICMVLVVTLINCLITPIAVLLILRYVRLNLMERIHMKSPPTWVHCGEQSQCVTARRAVLQPQPQLQFRHQHQHQPQLPKRHQHQHQHQHQHHRALQTHLIG